MNRSRWQFSLRQLLVVVTLIAGAVAFVAQYPGIALLFLVISPLVAGAQVLAYVIKKTKDYAERRSPRWARFIYLFFGTVCVVGSLFAWITAQHNAPNWSDKRFGLVTFIVFGLYSYFLAWAVPVASATHDFDDGTVTPRQK